MISAQQLDALDPQTRQAVQSLLAQVQQRDAEIAFKQALIDKLTHEMAVLKRLKFAATSERFAASLAPEQKSLLEETLEADLAELGQEIERERGKAGDKDKTDKKTPKRTPLPPHLPRRDVNISMGYALHRSPLATLIETILHEVEVSCLPADIPAKIEVDVSGLTMNNSITVGDLQPPAGVEFVTEASEPVVVAAAPLAHEYSKNLTGTSSNRQSDEGLELTSHPA